MYKYVKDMQLIALEKLDIRKFINNDHPLIKLGFSSDTTRLKRNFNLRNLLRLI